MTHAQHWCAERGPHPSRIAADADTFNGRQLPTQAPCAERRPAEKGPDAALSPSCVDRLVFADQNGDVDGVNIGLRDSNRGDIARWEESMRMSCGWSFGIDALTPNTDFRCPHIWRAA